MPALSQLLVEGKSPADILSILFKEIPHKRIGSKELNYSCSCSHAKMESALFSLGEDDLRHLLEKENGAEVHCEFCRLTYKFGPQELEKLLELTQKKSN